MVFTPKSQFFAATLLICGYGMSTPLLAATLNARDTPATTKTHRVNKVQIIKGSEESSSERAQRLKRECKGRHNAGACLGYTG